MPDKTITIYPPEKYDNTAWPTKIRNWLIELLAGKKPVMLNIKISIVENIYGEDIGLHCTGLHSGLLSNLQFDTKYLSGGKIYRIETKKDFVEVKPMNLDLTNVIDLKQP